MFEGSLLYQTISTGPLAGFTWIISVITFFYLFYKVTKDIFTPKAEAEAKEFRKTLLGIPALVVVLGLIALATLTISLEKIFGPISFIPQVLLGIFVPIAMGVIFVLPIAFVISLWKKELAFPGI